MELFKAIRKWTRTLWYVMSVITLANSASIRKLMTVAPKHGDINQETKIKANNHDLKAFHNVEKQLLTKAKAKPYLENGSQMEHNLNRKHRSSDDEDYPSFEEILNINSFSGDSDNKPESDAVESIQRTHSRNEMIIPINPFSPNFLHELESALKDSFNRDRRAAPSAAFSGRFSCCIGDIWCFRPCIFARRILTSSTYSRRKREFRASWGQTDELWIPGSDKHYDNDKMNILKYLAKMIHGLRMEVSSKKFDDEINKNKLRTF